MKLVSNNIYHLYNRGNNREILFHNRDNYVYFKRKLTQFVIPHIKLISYCLMPNHFHLMVYADEKFDTTKFSQDFKTMISSYTKAINIRFGRTGSLFQQNCKAKCLTDMSKENDLHYPLICFNYIHQNPVTAGIVNKIEDWEFSSFREYLGLEKEKLCSHQLAKELLGLPSGRGEFYSLSYINIDVDNIKDLL